MNAESCINNIPAYNRMVQTREDENIYNGLHEVLPETVETMKGLIKDTGYENSIGIDTDGSLTIELSNPYNMGIYEEIVVNRDKYDLYREDLTIPKVYGTFPISKEKAEIKIQINRGYIKMLFLYNNKSQADFNSFTGIELVENINVNSLNPVIIDFTGVEGIAEDILDEMFEGIMDKGTLYTKLSSVVLMNASLNTRKMWDKYIERYREN